MATTTRVNVNGKMYELETVGKAQYSGFKKRSQEEFYDLLSSRLIELLCEMLLSQGEIREVLLGGNFSAGKLAVSIQLTISERRQF